MTNFEIQSSSTESKGRLSNITAILSKNFTGMWLIGIPPELRGVHHGSIAKETSSSRRISGAKLRRTSSSKKDKITFFELERKLRRKYHPKLTSKEVKEAWHATWNDDSANFRLSGMAKNLLERFKKRITDKEYGSNKLSTIKQKGFDMPMVDTGQYLDKLKCWRSNGR